MDFPTSLYDFYLVVSCEMDELCVLPIFSEIIAKIITKSLSNLS